jgi:hypothetical protein
MVQLIIRNYSTFTPQLPRIPRISRSANLSLASLYTIHIQRWHHRLDMSGITPKREDQ